MFANTLTVWYNIQAKNRTCVNGVAVASNSGSSAEAQGRKNGGTIWQ